MSDPVFTEEGLQQVSVIDGMNAELTAVQQERDTAQANVRSLKRKYEPDDGVIMDKLLKLTTDYSACLLRVLIRTDEYLLLEIVPTVRELRHNGPSMHFRPPVQGKRDDMQDFGSYGVYQVFIGDGTIDHWCLVRFDKTGVSLTPINDWNQEDELFVIEELTAPAAVKLSVE